MASYILGISAYYHDSAAALICDGEIIAAAHEERFTRKKQDSGFPARAIEYCLSEAGLRTNDLELVVFYDKPLLKFERLLITYHSFVPKGLISFLSSIPVWMKEKLMLKSKLKEGLLKFGTKLPPILFPEHHLSHAASAFYPSPFEEAAILTLDGVGEWATMIIGHGKGNQVKVLRQLDFPHSLGLLYSAFTFYTGFKVNSGEYKLMGLAPYGNPGSAEVSRIIEKIKNEIVDIREDGSILLNQKYFSYATGMKMCNVKQWENLFGFPPRPMESPLKQQYMDMALAIQNIHDEIVLKLAKTARDLTQSKYLVLAGGSALNCVTNGHVLRSGLFEDIWIQPASGDAGGSLGAALAAWHIYLDKPRQPKHTDSMQGAYLGPEFDDKDILNMMRLYEAPHTYYEDFEELTKITADLLAAGNVVGWFQGRMEFGPRALGNRSILGDPRNPDMQKRLNLKIKYREGFRPFAPSCLEEDINELFELDKPSPYMLLVAPVKKERCHPLPEHYHQKDLKDRLYFQRSDMPSITHIDYSARIQSVNKETNPRYWQLINTFKQKTGYGVVVNTSFNVRGEPIICTPTDAYRCFMRTEMDYLVCGNYLLEKSKQKNFKDTGNWKDEFTLD